ncbi:MAG TPA: glycosyltransferase family 4 protein [Anaerolineae bacterium]|nr:glycosyltransferase family 4 protein [Anaerolineae bacterium]
MQQYTADLANQMSGAFDGETNNHWPVTVITNRHVPRDRYAPQTKVEPVVDIAGTGLQKTNINARGFNEVYRAIRAAQPDIVHFTGPHVWNPILLFRLKRAGFKTVHTIHDLDPHSGTGYGKLLYIWNNSIVRTANHILVHGQVYRDRLLQQGLSAQRVSYAPLLHLFLSYEAEAALRRTPPNVSMEPFALFFARIEAYKGVDTLLDAMRQLAQTDMRAVIAGKGEIGGAVPDNVEIRNQWMGDAEAIDLFARCRVVVLPYRDATQSALIAAAYFFGKPVIVTRAGALPEYVSDGTTGWIIEPGDSQALAECLRGALQDHGRTQQMGRAGRAWYETHYCNGRAALRHLYEHAAYA